jgi:predicted DCC family thiol-disulfide oxidoreductase YuxK
VLAVANQKPGVIERYGITRAEADRTAWTIDRDGRRQEGAAAINRVLAELGGPLSQLAALYRVSGIGALEEALYRWFAPRRSKFRRFGVTPECDEPDARCD